MAAEYLSRRGAVILALVALSLAAAVLAAFDPAEHGWYPRCPLRTLTGLLCPGCGGLRAGHHLLNGRLAEALRHNALAVALVPAAPFLLAGAIRREAGPDTRERAARRAIIGRFAVAVILAFWILRNLPVYPLTLLAP